jgi:hypothetical protein
MLKHGANVNAEKHPRNGGIQRQACIHRTHPDGHREGYSPDIPRTGTGGVGGGNAKDRWSRR